MNKRYKISLLLLCSGFSLVAFSQLPSVTLTGIITDSGGNKLCGALVTVVNSNAEIRSAKDGIYSLSLAPGEYMVTVSLQGFETLSVPVKLPAEDFIEESFILTRKTLDTIPFKPGKCINQVDAGYESGRGQNYLPVAPGASIPEGSLPKAQYFQG